MKSWAGEIGHGFAYHLPPLRHFFPRSCVARAQRLEGRPHKLVIRFDVIQKVRSKK